MPANAAFATTRSLYSLRRKMPGFPCISAYQGVISDRRSQNRNMSDSVLIATSTQRAQHDFIMAKKTILIVDDNRDAADSLAMLLEIKGHKVLIAYDAETGLEIAHQASPDVVIHDINLPQMNGYTAATKLRQDVNCSSAILVALTGFARPG